MTKLPKSILIAAAGTGGHVFPALVIANALRERGVEIVWLGTPQGLEQRIIPNYTIPIETIRLNGVRGKNLLTRLLAPWQIIRAVIDTIKIIRARNIDWVFAMGGYVSGPAGIAAWLLKRPLVLHEQNSIAGKTNHYLSRFAKTIFTAFPDVFPEKYGALLVGNPVRAEITAGITPEQRYHDIDDRPLRILILGGSQGAKAINNVAPSLWHHLRKQGLELWHQTGSLDFNNVEKHYQAFSSDEQTNLRYEPFIDDMASAYQWADLVICRAGALTLAELTTAGVASILIPFPHAVDNHQHRNARYLSEQGAAILLPQTQLSVRTLASLCDNLWHDRKRLAKMGEQSYQLKKTKVIQKVIDALEGRGAKQGSGC